MKNKVMKVLLAFITSLCFVGMGNILDEAEGFNFSFVLGIISLGVARIIMESD